MILLPVVVQSWFKHKSLVTLIARPTLPLPCGSVVEVPAQTMLNKKLAILTITRALSCASPELSQS